MNRERRSETGTATTVSEGVLVAALRAGESWAFEGFVRDQAGRVKAVAERFLRNEQDANDVVQETFLAAFKAVRSFEGKSQLTAWLHRIAINASLMKLRTRHRHAEQVVEPEMEALLPRFVGLGVHASPQRAFVETPEEETIREETRAFVRECIDRLPEQYRSALLLRDIEGFNNEDVAEHLGVSVNAAKIRVHRARQALRALLAPRLGEPAE